MPDLRVYHPTDERAPTELILSPEESHHLLVVNRARRGAVVIAFDGRGREWSCEVTDDSRKAARLTVRSAAARPPLPYSLSLGQALPKGKTMDVIVRKATELGAARILPLESERTEVRLEEDREGRKQEKWLIAAIEAAKQCGNPWLPEIAPLRSAAEVMRSSGDYDLKLLASLRPEAKSLRQVLGAFREKTGRPPRSALWLVGPEGDFTPAETETALAHGFEPITLGPLVLRCDTAALCALGILGYELHSAAP